MHTQMRQQLIDNILKSSVSTDIELATKEWYVEGYQGFGSDRCSCGQPIKYVYSITNSQNGNTLTVGSTCIEKFDNTTMNQTLRYISGFIERFPMFKRTAVTVSEMETLIYEFDKSKKELAELKWELRETRSELGNCQHMLRMSEMESQKQIEDSAAKINIERELEGLREQIRETEYQYEKLKTEHNKVRKVAAQVEYLKNRLEQYERY